MKIAENFKVVESLPIQASGKTIIQGFTGSGLVASLVANHLVDELGMIQKAYISSNLIPSVGIVNEGIIHRPVRIYESDKYVLMLSEVAITEENLVDFIEYLFDWYVELDPSSIVFIGGLPTGRPANASDLRYNVVASDEHTREFLSDRGIWTLPQGAIYGSVALSLMEAKRTGISGFSILSHCIATVPDYLAAKKVVEIFNVAMSEEVSTSELEEQAMELKDHLQNEDLNGVDEFDMESFDVYDEYDDYDDDDDDLSAFI